MAVPFTLDSDDVRILRALQIDPQVPLTAVAAALSLSEPTVSRRYARLRRTGVVRVVAVVDPGALGQSQWMVRVRCRPGGAGAMAAALAHRDDVSWVALGSGGTEITCAVRSRSAQQREELLGHRLPRASAVLDIEASVLLRKFLGERGRYWAALNGVLTAQEQARLGSSGSPFVEAPMHRPHGAGLDPVDEKLLAALTVDGRASLVDLASAADLTPGRTSRRLARLLSDGVAHLHVEIAPAALGFHTLANLWLRVRPAEISTVGRTLATMPEVGFVAATSGRNNLHVAVHCHDLDELFEFVSGRLGTMPGVESVEVGPIDSQVKQAGTLLDGDRLEAS